MQRVPRLIRCSMMRVIRTRIKCSIIMGLQLLTDWENVLEKSDKDLMPVGRCAKTDTVDSSSEHNHELTVPIWKSVFSVARFHSSWASAQDAEIYLSCLLRFVLVDQQMGAGQFSARRGQFGLPLGELESQRPCRLV
jgi:hypothetical protein